jgi:shikimate kinase
VVGLQILKGGYPKSSDFVTQSSHTCLLMVQTRTFIWSEWSPGPAAPGTVMEGKGCRAARVAVVARVLVTGMSGAGKSTLLDELRRRGHLVVDTDYDKWVGSGGTWDEPRMTRLLRGHRDVVVSGTVDNQVRFYDRFEHIVLLSAPLDVLLVRVAERANNPYGSSSTDRAAIARYVETVEPLLRKGATLELDGRLPVRALADAVEQLT